MTEKDENSWVQDNKKILPFYDSCWFNFFMAESESILRVYRVHFGYLDFIERTEIPKEHLQGIINGLNSFIKDFNVRSGFSPLAEDVSIAVLKTIKTLETNLKSA